MHRVMIGCPVRNRAWILKEYLQCLVDIDYPEDSIEYCFIINDCIDETPYILEDFAKRQTVTVNLIYENSNVSSGHLRGEYSFQRLAYLRNCLLREFITSKCDYLLSVDSDILVQTDLLKKLINDNFDIISCLVCNGHEIGNLAIYNILNKNEKGQYLHMTNFPRDTIFKVDCTGAAYLIKRRVIGEYGIRYSAVYGAEDIGFCENAINNGLEIYCDGRIECKHVMRLSNAQ